MEVPRRGPGEPHPNNLMPADALAPALGVPAADIQALIRTGALKPATLISISRALILYRLGDAAEAIAQSASQAIP